MFGNISESVTVMFSAATAVMIKDLQVDCPFNIAFLQWKIPKILPDYYRIKIICYNPNSSMMYRPCFDKISRYQNWTEVILYAGVECDLTLFATYNPASNDPGLTVTVHTKEPRE